MQDVDLDFLSPRTPPPPRILGKLTFFLSGGGYCTFLYNITKLNGGIFVI